MRNNNITKLLQIQGVDYRSQTIQHLNFGSFTSFLILNKRRYLCKHCGKRFDEHYEFLQRFFRKSNLVFSNVILDLKQTMSFKSIALSNNISIPTVVRYMHYATFLANLSNISSLPKRIGIDEFKGNCNGIKYLFHIYDLDTHKTIDIVKSRDYVFNLNPILKYAYELKEDFLRIRTLPTFEEKETAFKKWLDNADGYTISEFKPCVNVLRQWHEYISNYFKTGITNGSVECKNNLIKVLKRVSFGFRNFNNFRARILIQQL